MKHVWHECNDLNCNICDGGLAWCIVCGLVEGELTTDCPGYKVSYQASEACYGKWINFVDAHWIVNEKWVKGNN